MPTANRPRTPREWWPREPRLGLDPDAERVPVERRAIRDRYDGQVALVGRRFAAYPELRAALDALLGVGPGDHPAVLARAARGYSRELIRRWMSAPRPLRGTSGWSAPRPVCAALTTAPLPAWEGVVSHGRPP